MERNAFIAILSSPTVPPQKAVLVKDRALTPSMVAVAEKLPAPAPSFISTEVAYLAKEILPVTNTERAKKSARHAIKFFLINLI